VWCGSCHRCVWHCEATPACDRWWRKLAADLKRAEDDIGGGS